MKKQLKPSFKVFLITLLAILWHLPLFAQPAPCDCNGFPPGPDLDACLDACGGTNDVPLDDYLPIMATAGAALGLYFFIKRKALS
jgi:hypothetical protein